MTPKRYPKKPVEVEAVQWTGENIEEILEARKALKEELGR